ncbi:hypothetical protein LPTSP4_09710 [Leptospira ryugenii]|uniref:Uncharacterized protein n=1 Tax=Leptospira ryugenii TaxID=1917863 RepID=A0A2P2DXU2_9LEPT|nr:hypothetical protein [Leptospira ryugenii]GBF49458.1 hypothetical protein LPTSP4_09710 [Leptospira ryugenii]
MKRIVILLGFVCLSLLNLNCSSSKIYRYKSEEQVPASELALALNTNLSIKSINNVPLDFSEFSRTLDLFYINPGKYEISAYYSSNRTYSTNSKIITFDVQKGEIVILCALAGYKLSQAGYNSNSGWIAFPLKVKDINLDEHKFLFSYSSVSITEKYCIPAAKQIN